MKIDIRQLSYGTIQDGIKWLDNTLGPRLYWLHNQRGGQGWSYHSAERTIEINDEKTALMFLLKFGGSCDQSEIL